MNCTLSIRTSLDFERAMQESYVALEKAIRSLAEFYSKAGPFGSLPGDVKTKILDDLNAAEANL